jgi:hypothetical protein
VGFDIQKLRKLTAENQKEPQAEPTFDERVQEIVSRVQAVAEQAAKVGLHNADCICGEIVWKPYQCGTLLDIWLSLRGVQQEHINKHYWDADNQPDRLPVEQARRAV